MILVVHNASPWQFYHMDSFHTTHFCDKLQVHRCSFIPKDHHFETSCEMGLHVRKTMKFLFKRSIIDEARAFLLKTKNTAIDH